MHYFYAPDLESSAFLPDDEAQHAIKVLRLKTGDDIRLINGRGGMFEAKIESISKRECSFSLGAKVDVAQRNFRLHMAVAPTKNIDRTEWFVEKAVEIGVDEITPVICRFSERKTLKNERLEKIIVSAMKQSLKAQKTVLNEAEDIKSLIKNAKETQKFIAHCDDDAQKASLKKLCRPACDTLVLIGPEGDFSPEEIRLAKECGFLPVSLGESRLRTETAGIVACHTVNLINEI